MLKLSDLKYLLSFIIPLSCYFNLMYDGLYSWLTLIIAFVLVPLIELVIKPNGSNEEDANDEKNQRTFYFKLILYLNVPTVYGLLILYFTQINQIGHFMDLTGKTIAIGILLGANAINVAHELGHKSGKLNYWAAKLLLIPCQYTYFTLQHNRGHHVHVGTAEDPATARLNEHIYKFWLRCIPATIIQAFSLEKQRMIKQKLNLFSLKNEMVVNLGLQLIYLLLIFYFFGFDGWLCSLTIAIISILLLESINYVEHYGLERKLMENGRFENVAIMHSWNSNHILGRVMLFELTRHADHHFKSNKAYQTLQHHEDSPQLPYGYPASMLLSLIPPLWFHLIHPILNKRKTISLN